MTTSKNSPTPASKAKKVAKAAAAAPRKAKNPDKLTGPEKVRFLSVLSKDPELQADVVAQLRDLSVIPKATKDRLDEGVKHLPPPMRQAYRRVEGVAQDALHTVEKIKEREDVGRVTARLSKGAELVGAALDKKRR